MLQNPNALGVSATYVLLLCTSIRCGKIPGFAGCGRSISQTLVRVRLNSHNQASRRAGVTVLEPASGYFIWRRFATTMGPCYSRVSSDRPSESTQSDNIDSTITSLVCNACWNGIFSTDAWQTVLVAKQVPGRTGFSKGFAYKTNWAAIQTAADRDKCSWCRLVARPHLAATKGDSEVEVWAACDEDSDCTPIGEKKLTVVIEATGVSLSQHYYMYTSSGTFGCHAPHTHVQCISNCSFEWLCR